MIKTVSESKYEEFKSLVSAQNYGIHRAEVSISELELISMEDILVRGTRFKMEKKAFRNLVTSMGISATMLDRMQVQGKDLVTFVNNLKPLMKQKKNDRVVLTAINRGGLGIITRFDSKLVPEIQSELFFDLVDRAINQTNMEIAEMDVDPSGFAYVNLVNNKNQIDLGGDESFVNSMNFVFRPMRSITLGDGNYRLVCTNGMFRGNVFSTLESISKDSMQKFLTQFDAFSTMALDSAKMGESIKHTKNVNASYSEMKKVFDTITKNSELDEVKAAHIANNDFIPLLNVAKKYNEANVMIDFESQLYQSTAKTPVKMWDLINTATWLGSHNSELKITAKGKTELARVAGEFMSKDRFDLESIAPSVY